MTKKSKMTRAKVVKKGTLLKKPSGKTSKKKTTRIKRENYSRRPQMFAPVQPAKKPKPGDSGGGDNSKGGD